MVFKELLVWPSVMVVGQDDFSPTVDRQLSCDDIVGDSVADDDFIVVFVDCHITLVEGLVEEDVQQQSIAWVEPVLFVLALGHDV